MESRFYDEDDEATSSTSLSKPIMRRQTRKAKTPSAIPKIRQELLRWNGWGYKDSHFYYENNMVGFSGDRYPVGNLALPYFKEWIVSVMGVDQWDEVPSSKMETPVPGTYPPPILNETFFNNLKESKMSYSIDEVDRLFRSHGHTLHDIYTLRESKFPRIPDVVVWPDNQSEVEILVALACEHNVVVIPIGGGTSVSGALECPANEKRTIVSCDTSQMNRILWLDEENLVARIESGIIGQDLEKQLRERGYTTGHEPDSYEFSSLGGWVATRASGMKKNTYGNIEDLVIHVTMVTPQGLVEKGCEVPRMSCGPDVHHFILGSEGTLGVITEVTLKIRPIPKCQRYGSVVFPDFAQGVAFMREVAKQRCQPSSIRLMDNEQFKFGQALRPVPGFFGSIGDAFKRFYVTKLKNFDVNTMCVATLLFEGSKEEVDMQEKRIYSIGNMFSGLAAGETNGLRGYMLTFVIAYIRDFALQYKIVAESFETSVPWNRTYTLCTNVKKVVSAECSKRGIKHFLISCRVTQTYDSGSCVYFYFAFNYDKTGLEPLKAYEEIEMAARDEIIHSGGSISHHHGIGKIRQRWVPDTLSQPSISILKAIKSHVDPNNIFGNQNLIPQLKAKL